MTEYYDRAGLTPYLEQLGFHTVGYGCTTCIGNSGPLPEPISVAVEKGDLVVCSVLSGNRNFEARIHPEVKANYLASPPLVVAYALAGRMDVDLSRSRSARTRTATTSSSATSGRARTRSRRRSQRRSAARCSAPRTPTSSPATTQWRELPVPEGELFAWEPDSTYVRQPPYFDEMPHDTAAVRGHRRRALPRHARRLGHDRPHLAGRLDQARLTRRART